MNAEDKAYFDSVVHQMRSRGYSKEDAEDFALEKLNDKWFPNWGQTNDR